MNSTVLIRGQQFSAEAQAAKYGCAAEGGRGGRSFNAADRVSLGRVAVCLGALLLSFVDRLVIGTRAFF
jgi:hypothetical protein